MKPVAFFRGSWRKKEGKPPHSPSSSTVTSPSTSRPSTSSSTSILPMQSSTSERAIHFPYNVFTKQGGARSDIFADGSLGHIVPEPGFLRQRTYSASAVIASAQSHATPPKPKRPHRPPGLNLSSDPPFREEDDAEITPRPPFSAPPASKTNALRPSYRKNRSNMELDGVWKGFLAELDEDFDFLDLSSDENSPEKLHRRCFSNHHRDAARARNECTHRPSTSPSSELSPLRTFHPFSRSMSNISLQVVDQYTSPHEQLPSRMPLAKHAPTTTDTLSMFPSPPPLNIRRGRTPPKPLILAPTPSIASLPPSPSISTPDTTPVATPTTPRFCQSPSNPHRDLPPPASILKKRPTTSGSGQIPIDVSSSPVTSSPRSLSIQVQLPPMRPLRPAQSTSNFHGSQLKPAVSHKATSSDSQALDKHAVRRHQASLSRSPLQPMHNSEFQSSYLQSKGRTRPKPSLPQSSICWGHAV